MRVRALAILVAAGLAPTLAACGSSGASPGTAAGGPAAASPNAPEVSPAGDIPDTQAYVAYRPPGSVYTVRVPEGWARSTAAGGVTTFTDKLNRVEMQQRPAGARLTAAQAMRTLVPAGARTPTITTVTRTAGAAIRIAYLHATPADPVTGKSHTDAVERYVFFHRPITVVLTLSGPRGADNVDPWRTITDSLRYTR